MKPGKPTTFATLNWKNREKYVLGLPGNPVSATVTSHLYVLPAARSMSGYSRPFPAQIKARLSNDAKLDPRPEYMRVILSWDGQDPVANIISTGNQVGQESYFTKKLWEYSQSVIAKQFKSLHSVRKS